MKVLASLLILGSLVAPTLSQACDDEPGGVTAIESKSFFTPLVGRYKIQKAGGLPPHESGAIATIERETGPDQTVLTLTYCPPGGGCDPGFLFFEDSLTKVTQEGNTWVIVNEDTSGKKNRYSWTQDGSTITFRNFQYAMPSGQIVTLEHVMVRAD